MNKTIIKKEFHESLFDCKGLWLIVACACVLSGLCVLVISIKEGSVLAQNDVLQYAMNAAMFLTVTISMVLGSACFAAEREENTMESLLLTPVRKRDLVVAKYLGVMLIGVALYIVCVPYLTAIGMGSGLTWRAITMTFFGGLLLLTAFTALSVVFSIKMKSSRAAILTSILGMTVLTVPALIKGLFTLSPLGLTILKIDPIACCFDMMDAVLAEKQPFFSQWNYILPLLGFAAVTVALMLCCGKSIALKGEK